MNISDTQFLGVDVGGTHLKIGLVDNDDIITIYGNINLLK